MRLNFSHCGPIEEPQTRQAIRHAVQAVNLLNLAASSGTLATINSQTSCGILCCGAKLDHLFSRAATHRRAFSDPGVYYKPGSLKARLCVAGAKEMVEFCSQHKIPHEVCGKLIAATSSIRAARLEDLLLNGVANGLAGLRLLDRAAMRRIEPHAGGVRALHVPSTGITDYAAVAAKYAEIAKGRGTEIRTGAPVCGFDRSQDASAKIATR